MTMATQRIRAEIDESDPRQRDLEPLFAAIDAKDAKAFTGFLTEKASFRFGSSPAARGAAEIEAAVSEFFASLKGLSHVVNAVVTKGDMLFCEGETTYTRHDGKDVVVPFADVFEYENEKIAEYRIYADLAPLFAD